MDCCVAGGLVFKNPAEDHAMKDKKIHTTIKWVSWVILTVTTNPPAIAERLQKWQVEKVIIQGTLQTHRSMNIAP